MKILILGGTVFVGRHLVEAARRRGHRLTLFHRGRSRPDLFPDVQRLIGDRTTDLRVLEGRRWDAAIDTCGYMPADVRASARALAEAVGLYVFVSSVSAYRQKTMLTPAAGDPPAGVDEQGPLETLIAEQLRDVERLAARGGADARSLGASYGPLKALCEQAAEETMPGRVLRIRPGLIVGPHDYSGRFTYWVRRVAEGGEVLAPGRRRQRVRFIDARDLAEWIVRRVEVGDAGVYNAAGPPEGWIMEQVLDTCKTESGSDASFTWVGEQFLEAQGVAPWTELPLWLPEAYSGFFAVRNERAIAAGLTFRPLAETVRDTLAWDRETSFEPASKVGLEPAVERELLRLHAGG